MLESEAGDQQRVASSQEVQRSGSSPAHGRYRRFRKPRGAPRQSSGRYDYGQERISIIEGVRVRSIYPAKPDAESGTHPSHIDTTYENGDGLRTCARIAIDCDADKASVWTKDDAGVMQWDLMRSALAQRLPELAHAITIVARSTSGKGLGLAIDISPLPLRESTAAAQRSALALQQRLIDFFREMGFGADAGAIGLRRKMPNWRDPAREVRDPLEVERAAERRRFIERTRLPVVSELHTLLDEDEEKNPRERLYRDARVERKLGIMLRWALGEFELPPASKWPDGIEVLERIPFLSGARPTATVKQLVFLTGLSDGFVRRLLQNPPPWMRSEYVSREEGWRLEFPMTAVLLRLLDRAILLCDPRQHIFGRAHYGPKAFPRPETVRDGERNRWIFSLAILYRRIGLSEVAALDKVRLRIARIEGHDRSRNCRQARHIVRSIYRRAPSSDLEVARTDPAPWVLDDSEFLGSDTKTRAGAVFYSSPGRTIGPMQGSPSWSEESPGTQTPTELARSIQGATQAGPPRLSLFDNALPLRARVLVIRAGQRIGLLDEETGVLVGVFTNVLQWRESAAEAWLSTLPRYAGCAPRCHSPRKVVQRQYAEAVLTWDSPLCATIVCGGRRRTRDQALSEWRAKRNLIAVDAPQPTAAPS